MARSPAIVLQAALVIALAAHACPAAIFPQERGAWPQDWPQVLEPLRETSRTLGVGTAIQENIYEIPIPDRATFDKIWPAIRKLRTPGSPLTLYRTSSPPPKDWGDFLSNARPAVRIYAPTGSYTTREEIDPQNPADLEALVREGRALRTRGPWPKSILGEKGELPEYVISQKGPDGKLVWIPADPHEDAAQKRLRGFYNRARIDVELVVDGDVIDLNRVPFPDGVTIIDRRFAEEPSN